MSGDLYPEDLLGPSLPAHLYVHVPFCASKCAYCDFASVSGATDDVVRGVFTGIRTQLRRWEVTGLSGVLETVYVGGGTPSRYPEEVVRTLDFVRTHFALRPDAEVTVEANPDSLDPEIAGAFAEAGVTRISIGVQSFDDSVLRLLGRRHDARAAWDACKAVSEAGLDLSVDLMCGVPGQTITSWTETLTRAAAARPRHVSVYPLSVEDATPLQVAIDTGLLEEPDSDTAAEMMTLAETILRHHSLHRYEVANYAEGKSSESRHNTAYWSGRQYIGVGPGAHGMLDAQTARVVGLLELGDQTTARVRYANAPDIDEWLVGHGDSAEPLTADEAAREDVMLGMRLVHGVAWSQVQAAGLTEVLEGLAGDGLVELARDAVSKPGPNWRTTERGWLLGNEVFSRIWAGE
jgi:putative oxygen-independent coproporphyrinogen III oxidase